MSYFGAVTQNVVASTLNSSNTNIGPGATFTGAYESSLGVAGIQVSLKTDQNCTVQVQQSPDSSNWDLVDTHTTVANVGEGRTYQAISSYLRVLATNNGDASTSYFRLQTALCPIVEVLPRNLTSDGFLKTATSILDGQNAKQSAITPTRTLRTCTVSRLVGATFYGLTLDSNFWASITATGGTVSQSGGYVECLDTTSSGSSAILLSQRMGRYVTGTANCYRGIVQVPDATNVQNNTRLWGATNASTSTGQFTDGLAFYLKDGTFGVAGWNTASSSTNPAFTTSAASANWNGNAGTKYKLDTNAHTYEIHYTNTKGYFYIDDILVHTLSGSTTPLSSTLHFRVHTATINTGVITGTAKVQNRVVSIQRLGQLETNTQFNNITAANTSPTILKNGPGVLHMVCVNNPSSAATNTLTLYDNTTNSGPTIATVLTGVAAGGSISNISPYMLHYKVAFNTALTYVTSATFTANVTLSYE